MNKKKNNPQDLDQHELEYNDGLGDMLRDKDASKDVGIWKIAMMIISILIIVVLFGGLSYKLGKKIWVKKQHKIHRLEKLSQRDIALRIKQIEKEHKKIIKKIEADFANKRLNKKSEKVIKPISEVKPVVAVAVPTSAVVAIQEKPVVLEKKISHVKPVVTSIKRKIDGYPYKVIVGSFKNLNNAQAFMKELNARNIQTCMKVLVRHDGGKLYQIQAGAFSTKAEAGTCVKSLKAQGIDAFVK